MSDSSRRDAIKEIKLKIDVLADEEKCREALLWERKLIDTYHERYKLYKIHWKITFSEEEISAMRGGEADASSLFLIGFMLYLGFGGVSLDDEAAYECFSRAVDMGHIYALFRQGWMLHGGQGVEEDRERGLQCYMRAAEAGCSEAALWAGEFSTDKRTSARYLAMGARLGHSNCKNGLSDLLRYSLMEVAPFGEWNPDPITQMTVPNEIHEAMWTTLLIFKKKFGFPKDVIHMILFFVCTRSGWDLREEKYNER